MKKKILLLSCMMLVALLNAQSQKPMLAKNSFKENSSPPASLVSIDKKDTMKNKIKITAFYIGLGYDLFKKEPASFNTSLVLGNSWGISYRFIQNDFTAKNLPSDYATFEDIRFVKQDRVSANSFSISKEFQPKTKLIRFGIEAGPSFITYRKANFTFIPGYKEERFNFLAWFFFGDGSYMESVPPRYISSYSTHKSMGLNLRTKMEFPLTRNLGFEFAAFGNFNEVKSSTGVEFCLTLGLVREKNATKLNSFLERLNRSSQL